jgi:hypothetical protein
MTTRPTVLLAAIAAALATLASCGNGGSDAIEVHDYQRQVNAICTSAIDEMNGVVQPMIESTLASMGAEPFDPPQLQGFYRALTDPTDTAGALIDDMLDTLRELPRPAEHADDYTRLWADIDRTMAGARADIAEAAADPDAAIELWDIDTSPFTPVDTRSRELGVPACALDR